MSAAGESRDVYRNLGTSRGGAGSAALGCHGGGGGDGDVTEGVWRRRRPTGWRPGLSVLDVLGLKVKRRQETLCLPQGNPRQEVAPGHQEVT